jgi:hypothetical protein
MQIQVLRRVSQALESGVIELIDEKAMTTVEGNVARGWAKTQMMGVTRAAGRR